MSGIQELFRTLAYNNITEFTADEVLMCHSNCSRAVISRAKKQSLLRTKKVKGEKMVYSLTSGGEKYIQWLGENGFV